MKDNLAARTLFILFLCALGFIFAPVFMGNVSVHDEMNVAIPEDKSLLLRPDLPHLGSQSVEETCSETPN